ncbi:DUF6765 family protein [Candidatus Magnetominusculus xianensis]|uniref:Uncharacterized protein n=1 Tax=Candidatus Magnetominusculus xianensis TaxID=1748249 RepID=A0ABR5SBZ3_9BACT|nr:DUF6765 family protein [Candidatus Magnetominusculus xianensis]KWT78407.1 hypothetical protein ASN18_2815 [Candidatus Magnetominusculus xianensis]MBF0403166.1 hypothetical protein [Nitrospirota bacterium]
MERDFHYNIIYSIARLTQCNEPEIIAHASQFADDNSERWFGEEGAEIPFPEKIPYSTGGHYCPIMTQSMSPLSVDPYIQKFVYVPFHFLPGNDMTISVKGKTNPLSTTPNSQNAQNLLMKALQSNDPYRLGIALHTFADTWSHQNFTGIQEDWNSVYPWYNVKKYLVPNIGHAEAGHSPDVISEIWTDHRLDVGMRQIENKTRAIDAVKEIYSTLRTYTGKGPAWNDVKKGYTDINSAVDFDARIDAISNFVQNQVKEAVPAYDNNTWINDALQKNGASIEFKNEITLKGTHWYKFNQAAKKQLTIVLGMIENL